MTSNPGFGDAHRIFTAPGANDIDVDPPTRLKVFVWLGALVGADVAVVVEVVGAVVLVVALVVGVVATLVVEVDSFVEVVEALVGAAVVGVAVDDPAEAADTADVADAADVVAVVPVVADDGLDAVAADELAVGETGETEAWIVVTPD